MFKKLTARIIVFALACLWVLGWLGFGALLMNPVWDFLSEDTSGGLFWFFFIWFNISLLLVGIAVVTKAFRFVGKWERKNGKDK